MLGLLALSSASAGLWSSCDRSEQSKPRLRAGLAYHVVGSLFCLVLLLLAVPGLHRQTRWDCALAALQEGAVGIMHDIASQRSKMHTASQGVLVRLGALDSWLAHVSEDIKRDSVTEGEKEMVYYKQLWRHADANLIKQKLEQLERIADHLVEV
ncbi:unnamed protein product [Pedinophyceae sp. YPF-701]|nr:unnamed protein product [Pedinophyceae sp. YPF-701]